MHKEIFILILIKLFESAFKDVMLKNAIVLSAGPTLRVAKGDQGGYIKTPKRHSIKRAVEKLPSVKVINHINN